jgi:integrase
LLTLSWFFNLLYGPVEVAVLMQLHRALATTGLPTMRVHDLRHMAATILLTAGIHPKVVQEMLGHSTIGATLDIYSHVRQHSIPRRRRTLTLGAASRLFENVVIRTSQDSS